MSIRLVLLNGSLRVGSTNGAVLAAAGAIAPEGVEARLYDGVADLPHFNPDDDVEPLPPKVAELRETLRQADAVLISTPEYAGSLPGGFKNALDWTVGGASLYEKPVGWINASAYQGGAETTYAALRIVLERAGARIIDPACRHIPAPRSSLNAAGAIADPQIITQIAEVVAALVEHRVASRDRGETSTA